MKKSAVVFGIFVLMAIMFISFVSAQTPTPSVVQGTNEVLGAITGVLEPLTKWIIGDTGGDSGLFFAKFLLLIIIVALVYFPVKFFPGVGDNRFLIFIISLAVGLLGVRFLSDEIIATITLPYSAFAVAITALLPLILYFIWVERGLIGRPTLRKVAWIFAAVIFVGLFIARYEEIGNITPGGFNPVWYYMIAAGASVIFLIADGTIQRAWAKSQAKAQEEIGNIALRAELAEKYEKIRDRHDAGHLTANEANRLIRHKIHKVATAHQIDKGIFPLFRT